MIFSQIPLNLWNENYENEWIIGESNNDATNILLNNSEQVLLCGPRYCGKKHLAFKIAKMNNCNVFFTNTMHDAQIVETYDAYINKHVIWVISENIKEVAQKIDHKKARCVAKDVVSRLNSIQRAEIYELTEDMLFPLLNNRLSSLGFSARNEIINYCIYRMPRKYEYVNACIEYVKMVNRVSLRDFKEFFEQKFK